MSLMSGPPGANRSELQPPGTAGEAGRPGGWAIRKGCDGQPLDLEWKGEGVVDG